MKQDDKIDTAMILAAGLGTRMRPITERIPKPLVPVAGKCLLDYALDALVLGKVDRAIVNVHHLAGQIEAHLRLRDSPTTIISDERNVLLDSGGGVKKAVSAEPDGPIFILNADSFWVDADRSTLGKMESAWDPQIMDMILLISTAEQASGFEGAGDFFMDEEGRLTRRGNEPSAPYIYAGAIITNTQYINTVPDAQFSLNRLFDSAIGQNRLYGCLLDGLWLHVGTPSSIAEAEQFIERYKRQR